MTRIIRFLRALARQPKTSAAGIAALVGVILAAVQDPAMLAEPGMWVALLTAIGLLAAADGRGGDGDSRGGPPGVPAVEQRAPAADERREGKVVPISERRLLRLAA